MHLKYTKWNGPDFQQKNLKIHNQIRFYSLGVWLWTFIFCGVKTNEVMIFHWNRHWNINRRISIKRSWILPLEVSTPSCSCFNALMYTLYIPIFLRQHLYFNLKNIKDLQTRFLHPFSKSSVCFFFQICRRYFDCTHNL